MDWTENWHAAGAILATVLLTSACSSAPRKPLQQQQLSQWNAPEDCTTEYTAATVGLEPAKGGTRALLVDSVGTAWNCVAIPEGRYDAEIIARWSNGFQETTLLKNVGIAPGQILVAKAYQHARGPIPATIAEFRVNSEPVQPLLEATVPAIAESQPSTPDSPPTGQASASDTGSAPESPHPALQVAKIAGAVVVIAAPVILTRGHILNHLGGGGGRPYNTVQLRPQRTSAFSQPSAEYCFVWIEDGVTGEVIAGSRPARI